MLSGLPSNVYPLYSINKLSRILGIPKKDLLTLTSKVGHYYEPFDKYQVEGNKWRHIDNPKTTLRYIQRRINQQILRPVTMFLPEGMIGGQVGKSIVDNANRHLNKEVVVRIDIRDCFPNISYKRIYKIWIRDLGCGRNCANILTKLTSFQTRLPQGAPTSPALCNIALLPLFKSVEKLALQNCVAITFYVDDITISGKQEDVYPLIALIIKLIQRFGLSIRHKKINIMPASSKQKSVGLILNKKLAIERDKIEEVRGLILKLTKRKSISEQALNSVECKIRYIKSFSTHQGEKLEHLCVMLLDKEIYRETRRGRFKSRRCYSTKWHES